MILCVMNLVIDLALAMSIECSLKHGSVGTEKNWSTVKLEITFGEGTF